MKATRNIGKAIPLPPPPAQLYEPDTVTLELSIEEAQHIRSIFGKFATTMTKTGATYKDQIASRLYIQLNAVVPMDFGYHDDVSIKLTHFGTAFVQVNK